MRKIRMPVAVLIGFILLASLSLSACSEDDTKQYTDSEKRRMVNGMVDKYLQAWGALDAGRVLGLYASYAKIDIPEVGNLTHDGYRDYLTQLLGSLSEASLQGNERTIWLNSQEIAHVKFYCWQLLRTNNDEFYPSKTWISWELHWSDGDAWKIAVETGQDKLSVKDQMLSLLQSWAGAWQTKNLDELLTVYTADAVIIEGEGEQYDLAGYRELLAGQFEKYSVIQLVYSMFHIDWFTWEEADISFHLQATKYREGADTVYGTYDMTWRLVPGEESAWLVQRQEVTDSEVTADDDTSDDDTSDDDTSDDDTTDDDTSDDDTSDDDTSDDDTSDDDTTDDDTSDDDTSDDDTSDDDTTDDDTSSCE